MEVAGDGPVEPTVEGPEADSTGSPGGSSSGLRNTLLLTLFPFLLLALALLVDWWIRGRF